MTNYIEDTGTKIQSIIEAIFVDTKNNLRVLLEDFKIFEIKEFLDNETIIGYIKNLAKSYNNKVDRKVYSKYIMLSEIKESIKEIKIELKKLFKIPFTPPGTPTKERPRTYDISKDRSEETKTNMLRGLISDIISDQIKDKLDQIIIYFDSYTGKMKEKYSTELSQFRKHLNRILLKMSNSKDNSAFETDFSNFEESFKKFHFHLDRIKDRALKLIKAAHSTPKPTST